MKQLRAVLVCASMAVGAAAGPIGCRGAVASTAVASTAGDEASTEAGTAAAAPTDTVPQVPAPADVESAPASATRGASGLASAKLVSGRGSVHPEDFDIVRLRFVGWTRDGRTFGSTGTTPMATRVRSAFPAGLAEGVKQMVDGEKRRLWIPARLAFDANARRAGFPAGDVVMDVELVQVIVTPRPPPAPRDAAAPPPGVRRTASNVAYRLIEPGPKGARKPVGDSVVTYNYSTWTRDGTLVDSTIPEGEPRSAQIRKLQAIWRDVIATMHVGDRVRFWIQDPALVVDVELLYVYDVTPHA
jgi:peptidylprolyl isomerase